jgi:hypothetical protein
VAKIEKLSQPFIQNFFDSKLLEFKLWKNSWMISILAPFLAFSCTYIHSKVHDVLSIVLDPYLKKLMAIWDYVGNSVAIDVVVEYDVKVVYLLLLFKFTCIWIMWKQ